MSVNLKRFIEVCRTDLEDQVLADEVNEYLNRAENYVATINKNPNNFFALLDALHQEVDNEKHTYIKMRNENEKLGWTLSSARSSMDYDNKIAQFQRVMDALEQLHYAAKLSQPKRNDDEKAESTISVPFIGRR